MHYTKSIQVKEIFHDPPTEDWTFHNLEPGERVF